MPAMSRSRIAFAVGSLMALAAVLCAGRPGVWPAFGQTRQFTLADETSARKAVTYMNFDPRFRRNTIAAADLEQQALLALGRIKQPVDFGQVLNGSFVEKAMRTEPQFFADLRPVR